MSSKHYSTGTTSKHSGNSSNLGSRDLPRYKSKPLSYMSSGPAQRDLGDEESSKYEEKFKIAKRKFRDVQESLYKKQTDIEKTKRTILRIKRRNSLLELQLSKLEEDSPTTSEDESPTNGSGQIDKDGFRVPAYPLPGQFSSVPFARVSSNGTQSSNGQSPLPKASTSNSAANPNSRRSLNKPRRVQPLPKDEQGNYILPVTVGILTVVDLGVIDYNSLHFHNDRYIWPIGYTVKRYFNSTVDPDKEACYTATILNSKGVPKFKLTADDTDVEFLAESPTGAWTQVMRKANQIRSKVTSNSASGPDYFGFAHPTIAKMIQDLPNSDKCVKYKMQEFELMDPRYVPTRKWNAPPGEETPELSAKKHHAYKPNVPSKLGQSVISSSNTNTLPRSSSDDRERFGSSKKSISSHSSAKLDLSSSPLTGE